MITAAEIREKAERKYYLVLQAIIAGNDFSRLVIRGDKSYTKSSLQVFEKEILTISSESKEKKGFGYTLEFQQVKTKYLGTQDLPISIYFDSERDLFKFLGKEKEVSDFKINVKKIIEAFPELLDWVNLNPGKIIKNHGKWDSLILVCKYFKANPNPGLYTRELPIKVHTKFVESNKAVIGELLDVLIFESTNKEEKYFEKRYGLRYSEPLIRFKILDMKIVQKMFSGIDDISIPISQFERLKLPIKRVVVVENKTSLYTALTLPEMNETIAIFGQGNAVLNLRNSSWLLNKEILYWGDIDVQGFEILSRLRNYFPEIISVFMDKSTFDHYFEGDTGTITVSMEPMNLSEAETELYNLLRTNNWRLEQEKIPLEYVRSFFDK